MSTLTTANSTYITKIDSSTIAYVPAQPITRFIPMKRHVDIQMAESSRRISMRNISTIEEHMNDIPSLYYVQNNYNNDGFESGDITLFRFAIMKQTECYYFLRSGQRIAKTLRGRTYASTPTEAFGKAIQRANNYLEILMRRGKNVAEFLGNIKARTDKNNRELREFSKIVESLKNPDHVPSALYEKFTQNPKLFDELEL